MESTENVSAGGGTELSDAQIDSLVGENTQGPTMPSEAPVQQAPQAPQEYTIKVGGKEIKAPLDKILQWSQMGYNYGQRAQELNAQIEGFKKQQAEYDAKFKDYDQKLAPYREVDEYAAKNPEWWNQVQEQYKQKIQNAQTNPEIEAIRQEIQEFKDFKQKIMVEKETQARDAEDKSLAQEVEGTIKSYPNIDFVTPDSEGMTLEMKILKHADENKISTFRAAFRDYYHEHLLGKANEQQKEQSLKAVQQRNKLGILNESSKPTMGLRPAENVGRKTYDDLVQEALSELKTIGG